jgi:DNA polymerase I-like protein with 3'-5' exonuclease and polymerase domains
MSFIYLDIETDNSEGYNGLDVFNSRIVTLQMLLPSGTILITNYQVPLDTIKPVLENNIIVGHNLKFDSKFLKQLFGINLYHVYDTYIAEIVLSGGVYASKENRVGLGLKDLIYRYCGQQISKEEQTSFEYGVPLTQAQKRYVENDLRYLPEIYKKQQAKIKLFGLENTIDIEMNALPSIVWLELSGIGFDIEKINEVGDKLTRVANEKQEFLLSELSAPKGKTLNLNSTVQLLSALREKGFELNSTNEDELAKYSGNKIIDAILEYRSARKFLTTYIAPAFDKVDSNNKLIRGYINPDNHRTYANFNQYGTETGGCHVVKIILKNCQSKV